MYLWEEAPNTSKKESSFWLARSFEALDNLEKAYFYYQKALPDYPNKKIIKNRLKSIQQRFKMKQR